MSENILRELQGRGEDEPCSLPFHAMPVPGPGSWVLGKKADLAVVCAPHHHLGDSSMENAVDTDALPPRLVTVVDLIRDGLLLARLYSRNVSAVRLHFTLTSGTFGRRDIVLGPTVPHLTPSQ